MSRFTDYQAAAETGATSMVWRHDLMTGDGQVVASNDPEAAGVDAVEWAADVEGLAVEPDRVSERTASLSFPLDTAGMSLLPRQSSDALAAGGRGRVVSTAGLRLPDGSTRYEVQATLMVDEMTAEVFGGGGGQADVELVDTTNPVRGDLVTNVRVEEGEAVESVVARILIDVVPPDSFVVGPTGFTTLAGDVEAGTSRFDLVNELLEGCGHELIADRHGLLVTRPILPSDESKTGDRWRYGDNGYPIERITARWRSGPTRGWRVEGGGEPPKVQTVFDLDPNSEARFTGLGTQATIGSSSYSFAGTNEQLHVAGYGQLRRHGTGPGVYDLLVAPNPFMRQGDMVEIEMDRAGIDGSFRVIGFRLPIESDGLMTVSVRRVWEPSQGFARPGVEPDTDVQPVFTDDFDREDQNLELKDPSQGGVPEWVEYGWSWWIEDGRAIQRYPGWSMASPVKPLQSSDQFAEGIIYELPAGKACGFAVRSPAQFDGYVAMARNGALSLELWLGGKKADLLGSVAVSGSLAGRAIRVEAEGSTIRAKIDGSTVLTVTDGRLSGTHPGMVALGGADGICPRVESFAAGAL